MASRPEVCRILEVLRRENTLVLSSVSSSGLPHSAPLFYIFDENSGTLCWLSSRSSEHSVHVQERPFCSIAIFHPTNKWEEIIGLQMRGRAGVIDGAERDRILQRYRERFELGPTQFVAIERSTLYSFRPEWIRLIDNSVSFGYKFETAWPMESV